MYAYAPDLLKVHPGLGSEISAEMTLLQVERRAQVHDCRVLWVVGFSVDVTVDRHPDTHAARRVFGGNLKRWPQSGRPSINCLADVQYRDDPVQLHVQRGKQLVGQIEWVRFIADRRGEHGESSRWC